MKIFISGPMTGYANYNREEFFKAEKMFKDGGNIVLNPAYLPDGLKETEYHWLCRSMVDVVDAIYLLKGYEKSYGCQHELQHAKDMGLIILTEAVE